jgi:hypothetical protein
LIPTLIRDAIMPFTLTPGGPVLRIDFDDTITAADLEEVSAAFTRIEGAELRFTRRLTVLTSVTRMEVGFEEVYALAQRRLARTMPYPVKSALVAATPAQVGMARMFQTLNDHLRTTVRIFPDVPAALAWLDEDEPPP